MVVLNYTTMEVDQDASLAFLVFVECVDAADAKFIVDAMEIFGFHEGIDHVEGMVSDMELVELPILH